MLLIAKIDYCSDRNFPQKLSDRVK